MAHESSTELTAAAPDPSRSGQLAHRTPTLPLATSGVAGLLASVCCVGPLVLVLAGFSGAWVSNLIAFEPYRPFLLAAAAVALGLAWKRIYRPAAQCAPGEICAVPAVRRGQRLAFWLVGLFVVVAGASPYAAPLFY